MPTTLHPHRPSRRWPRISDKHRRPFAALLMFIAALLLADGTLYVVARGLEWIFALAGVVLLTLGAIILLSSRKHHPGDSP